MKSLANSPLKSLSLEVKKTGKSLLAKLAPSGSFERVNSTPPKQNISSNNNKTTSSEEDKFKWLQNMDIKTVIDVGAHTGQFALQIRKILPDARIYSFEPLSYCFKKLAEKSSQFGNFECFNVALGEEIRDSEIHLNKFSPSSSLLEMKEHTHHFPFTQESTIETIKVDTLDNFASRLCLEKNILLKIDVQGFEDKVICGGLGTLHQVKIIIVETSFKELYKNQPLFSDIYQLLTKLDFVYLGSWDQLKSPIDGSPCQEDSIFIKQ